MQVEMKIVEPLGEVVTTGKGSHIREFLIVTQQGVKEVVKILCKAEEKGYLLALKPGEVIKGRLPENFFFAGA